MERETGVEPATPCLGSTIIVASVAPKRTTAAEYSCLGPVEDYRTWARALAHGLNISKEIKNAGQMSASGGSATSQDERSQESAGLALLPGYTAR